MKIDDDYFLRDIGNRWQEYVEGFVRTLEEEAANDPTKIAFYIMPKARPSSTTLIDEDRVITVKEINIAKILRNLDKLEKYSKEGRFVAIVEKGDKMKAFVNAQKAEKLKENDQTIRLRVKANGRDSESVESFDNQEERNLELVREVEVQSLSDEQYQGLTNITLALINDAIEEYLQESKVDEDKDKEKAFKREQKPYLPKRLEAPEKEINQMTLMIHQLENLPESFKISFLRRMGEMQREIAKRNREEAIKREEKKEHRIEIKEEKRQIQREEDLRTELAKTEDVRQQKTETVKREIRNQ